MATEQRAVGELSAAKRSVLVVEDDPSIGGILAMIFEDEGYRVRLAPRGLEALRLVRQERPSVITLDLDLPDLPGEEILRLLGQDDELATIPVVILSAYTTRLRPTPQVFRVMDKPFNIDELLSTAQSALAG